MLCFQQNWEIAILDKLFLAGVNILYSIEQTNTVLKIHLYFLLVLVICVGINKKSMRSDGDESIVHNLYHSHWLHLYFFSFTIDEGA